ncbi:Transposase [Crocosphaera watsonii WH 0402]|uniref:Transposase n=1 Tax=Crocosphaera watsonii WH 0402 TaxID=1284629 RepID=T2JVW9_CROWT|nr:Transposase [Crocosphaera watsonii WH 0402]
MESEHGQGFCRPKNNLVKKQKGNIASIDEIQNNLLGYVKEIEDPRIQRSKKHLLKDVLAIAILAVIAGAQGWEDMENYGIAKQEWLSEFGVVQK